MRAASVSTKITYDVLNIESWRRGLELENASGVRVVLGEHAEKLRPLILFGQLFTIIILDGVDTHFSDPT